MGEPLAGDDFAKETARVAAGRPKGRSMGPLRGILPFLRPYRGRITLAVLALLASSAATLALPQFARGLIDARGLSAAQAHGLADFYFAFVVAAGVLGLASAIRFYMVTWLGERVVADIRKAVFSNVLGLSPQFFEVTRTGEVLSRMTADTTLIQTVVGSSASLALRNLVTLTGGLTLMFVTSAKLTLLVIGAYGALLPVKMTGPAVEPSVMPPEPTVRVDAPVLARPKYVVPDASTVSELADWPTSVYT